MAYSVQQLANLSGVSVRTLHYYDEIGLLRPAYHGANGYRFYEEEQLLRLQQILFFRELGFALKKIGMVLGRSDFDQILALQSHRRRLEKEGKRIAGLIGTIDKTIKHLKGEEEMEPWEFYSDFNKEKQAEYEEYLHKRLGPEAQPYLDESKANTKSWTKEDWGRVKEEGKAINEAFARAIDAGLAPDSDEVQKQIAGHYRWINRFYTPTKEVYVGLGELYNDHPDFRKHYEGYHSELAPFLQKAIQLYADRELC